MKGRILGIDPGSQRTGWGVIEPTADKPVYLAHGVIVPGKALAVSARLAEIHRQMAQVVRQQQVQWAALETVFVAGNVSSALKLGQARGAALAALGEASIDCAEYAPSAVKQAVTGSGRADKKQVGTMVRNLLNLTGSLPEDAADALAVALCHLFRYRATERIRKAVVPL